MKKFWLYAYVFLIISLVCLTYTKVFGFSFWRDDWAFYWGAVQSDRSFLTYFFHPGTLEEFVALSKLFGLSFFWWNAFGIFLKICCSFSVYHLIKTLTKSDAAGKISGLLFSVTPLGIEGVTWVSAHVVLLDTLFVCLAVDTFITYRRKKNIDARNQCIFFTLFALLCDPIRTLPMLVIYCLWIRICETKQIVFLKTKTAWFIGLACAVGFGAMLMNFSSMRDVRIVKAMVNHGGDISFYIQKIILSLWDPLSTLGNMIVSFLYPTPDVMGMSTKSIGTGFVGLLFCICLGYMYYLLRKRKNAYSMIGVVLMTWVILFFIPNWMFALFITEGYTNRYLVVSSVGFIGLIGYSLSRIANKKILFGVVVILVAVQMRNSWATLQTQDQYRSDQLHKLLYIRMLTEVPESNKQYLFLLTGDHPIVQYSFLYNMQMPFVAYRNILKRESFPIFVSHINDATRYVCGQKMTHSAAWQFIPVADPPRISDVYAWKVLANGTIKSIHEDIRLTIQKNIDSGACMSDTAVVQ